MYPSRIIRRNNQLGPQSFAPTAGKRMTMKYLTAWHDAQWHSQQKQTTAQQWQTTATTNNKQWWRRNNQLGPQSFASTAGERMRLKCLMAGHATLPHSQRQQTKKTTDNVWQMTQQSTWTSVLCSYKEQENNNEVVFESMKRNSAHLQQAWCAMSISVTFARLNFTEYKCPIPQHS